MTDVMFSRGAPKSLSTAEKKPISALGKKPRESNEKDALKKEKKENGENKPSTSGEKKDATKPEKETKPNVDKNKASSDVDSKSSTSSEEKKPQPNDDKTVTAAPGDDKTKPQTAEEKKKPLSATDKRKVFSSLEKKSRSLDEKRVVPITSLCSTPDSDGDVIKSKEGTPDTMLDRSGVSESRDSLEDLSRSKTSDDRVDNCPEPPRDMRSKSICEDLLPAPLDVSAEVDRLSFHAGILHTMLRSRYKRWAKSPNPVLQKMCKRFRRRQERDRYFTQTIDLSNMSTTVAGNKLAQEIHDEFLTCKICLEGFKSPKSLDCLHTFCESCIDNHVMSECSYKKYSDYREFTCPLCRKRTQLPLGGVKKLPDNFLVSSLGELVARQRPSKFPFCDICKLVNRKHREATSKCLDCNKLLCKACVDLHKETKVTKDHSLFDCEIEKDIECKEHQDEVVRFYCEPCETCICVLCTFNEHKDHEITQFSEAVTKYKEDIQTLLTACKTNIDVYDTQLSLLTKCESIIKAAEQRIHDVAIQFIADIRSREKQLIDELHAIYGPELMEYVNRKEEMQNNLDSLKSTCSLTELVLKGKDIELLLLKKQVQDKLSLLSDVTLKDLPLSVNKQVAFTPGSMDLGVLHDMDSPPHRLQTQLSLPATVTATGNGLHIRTTETQTDMTPQSSTRTVSRYIQTLPQHREDSSQGERPTSTGGESEWGYERAHKHTVATGTDRVYTEEKAVNTRSRSLMAQTNSTASVEDASEDPNGTSSSGLDPASSPGIARRQRRRRERQRPAVEVSVRPTTYSPASSTSTTVMSTPQGAKSYYSGFG